MIFTDKTAGYCPKYVMKDIATDKQTTVTISRLPAADGEDGTPLTAEVLGNAFAAKQNKLTAGQNIILAGDNIGINTGNIMKNYKMIAPRLIGVGAGYTASDDDLKLWRFAQPYRNDFSFGTHYLSAVYNPKMYFSAADVTFDVGELNYDVTKDSAPSIAVKFRNNGSDSSSVYVLFMFLQNKIRFIRNEGWLKLGEQSGTWFCRDTEGKFTKNNIRIMRYKNANNAPYTYRVLINGENAADFTDSADAAENSSVQIGTVGCKAVFENWTISGNH